MQAYAIAQRDCSAPETIVHWIGKGMLCIWPLLLPLLAIAQPVRYETVKGKIRIEGTSNIDDWQVETRSIAGYLKVGPDFPANLAHEVSAPKPPVQAEVLIEVGSLRSIEKDGKPFSNLMDEIMQAKLKAKEHPRIRYWLGDLTLTAPPKTSDAPYRFESKGDLVVAGITNHITMPISLAGMGSHRFRIWGSTSLRMTDFKIEPPAPKIALGIVKTGDEIKLNFEWVVTDSSQPHSAAADTLPR